MRNTDFAGLTELDPGESIATDDYGIQSRNPRIIDFFLRLGARTHRHDAHAALAAPDVAPTLAVASSGGTLPGDVDFAVGYTAVDSFGGETILSPVESIALPAPLDAPASVGSIAIDYTGGTLGVATYYYVKTWVDAAGGETTPSGVAEVDREPGSSTARVQLTNLLAGQPAGSTGWRIYKSTLGGLFGLVASGNTATWTDSGATPTDSSVHPPTINSTASTNKVTITVPDAVDLPDDAVGFRLYGTFGVGFRDPSLIREEPIANAGQDFDVTAWSPLPGTPPVVATAIAGATKIDAATEITNIDQVAGSPRWKGEVADTASLPTVGNVEADVRLALDDLTLHVWDGAAWQDLGGSGGGTAEAWQNLTLGWTIAFVGSGQNWSQAASDPWSADASTLQYFKDAAGVVHLKGWAQCNGTEASPYAFGSTQAIIGTLPSDHRPTEQIFVGVVPYYNGGGSPGWAEVLVSVQPEGFITVKTDIPSSTASQATGDRVCLDGLSFRAA